MLGREDLKSATEVKKNPRACPVLGCKTVAAGMSRGILGSLDGQLAKRLTREKEFEQYLCGEHGIYVTPTTFVYKDVWDNLLWDEAAERTLLAKVLTSKRMKAQLHHENSEDAVTWNVFRFLERSGLLGRFLTQMRGAAVTDPEAIYWTYCPSEGGIWSELAKAWDEFGERPQRASEPDVIVRSGEAVFAIEAKLSSYSRPRTSYTAKVKAEREGRYSAGQRYLRQPVGDIMDAGHYQLMRFWVLGCWIAERTQREFMLVNLVRSGEEQGIEESFGSCIRESQRRSFVRLTWEDIYEFIAGAPASSDRDRMMWYFRNKTIRCKKAFEVP